MKRILLILSLATLLCGCVSIPEPQPDEHYWDVIDPSGENWR